MAFKVGDKVKALGMDGEVICGPVRSAFGTYTGYVVRVDAGDVWYKSGDLAAIPETPKFSVGDKVRSFGDDYTVHAGPFRGHTEWYAIEDGDGKVWQAQADDLEDRVPEPVKVGDRVRVVKDSDGYRAGQYVGLVGHVERVSEGAELAYLVRFGDGSAIHGDRENGRWYCEAVEHVTDEDTYTYDGVTYDLSAKYSDGEDTWSFTGKRSPGGVPYVTCYANLDNTDTIESIADGRGPLTRVNA